MLLLRGGEEARQGGWHRSPALCALPGSHRSMEQVGADPGMPVTSAAGYPPLGEGHQVRGEGDSQHPSLRPSAHPHTCTTHCHPYITHLHLCTLQYSPLRAYLDTHPQAGAWVNTSATNAQHTPAHSHTDAHMTSPQARTHTHIPMCAFQMYAHIHTCPAAAANMYPVFDILSGGDTQWALSRGAMSSWQSHLVGVFLREEEEEEVNRQVNGR